jgi:hypothetical protein
MNLHRSPRQCGEIHEASSCTASELASDHGKRGTKAPTNLRARDLLANPDARLRAELVTDPEEGVHERQVQTILGTCPEYVEDGWVSAPATLPGCLTRTHVACICG